MYDKIQEKETEDQTKTIDIKTKRADWGLIIIKRPLPLKVEIKIAPKKNGREGWMSLFAPSFILGPLNRVFKSVFDIMRESISL